MGNYYLYSIAVFLTRLLPLSMSYAIATFLSDWQYRLSKMDREAVKENLKVILKVDQVPSAMVKDVFRHFGKYLVDFFTMTQRVNKEFIRNSVEILEVENLNEVLNKGKGGIILSAHMGNWEMGGAILSLLGYPLSVVALAHKDPKVNTFFNRQREFFGTTVIQTNFALRSCLEHLKRNRLVAILADRDFGHHGVTINFLGRKAIIPNGAAIFSLKTGAPIIPAFFLRTVDDKYHISFGKPIYPPVLVQKRINDQDVENFIKTYLPFIEEAVQSNPTQWLIFRRFEAK